MRPVIRARLAGIFLVLLALCACQPSDQRPGLWLHGDTASTLPADWRFSDAHREIFVEVATPYFLPHSVTIWCAQVDGALFIGARDPDEKNWPGWVQNNPDVRLKIGPDVYAVRLADVTDVETLRAVRAAYAEKYALGTSAAGATPNVHYWSVRARP